jgi:hypothetical protein
MNIKTILKSSVAASALFAFAVPVSTTAMAADDTFSSGSSTKLTMSGQISRSIWHGDDGTNDKTFFSSGDDTSRIRWVASGTLSDSVTAGATVEMDMPVSSIKSSATLHGGTDETVGGVDGTDGAWVMRHEYLWVNHKTMGKLSLGQTSTATDSVANATASGVTYSRTGKTWGGGLTFVNSTTASAKVVSTNSVNGVLSDLNVGKGDVIKYNSPTFAGTSFAVSRDNTSLVQTSLKYAGKFGAVAVTAAASYSTGSGSTNFTALGGMTATHDSGLNVSYQTGKKNYAGPESKNANEGPITTAVDTNNLGGRDDPYFHGIQVGYKMTKLVSVGGTNFAYSWQSSQNIKENDGDATSWGIRMKQSFDALGAAVSLGYSRYSYDAEGEVTVGTKVNEDYDDIDVIALQTVFNF